MARKATRGQDRPRTDGLRAMVAVAGVFLGWALTRELVLPPRLADGTLSVVGALAESAGVRGGALLFLAVALVALLCLQRSVRRRTGDVFADQSEWSVSPRWLLPGLALAALLPVSAMACVFAAAGLDMLLLRWEGSSLDLPVAVAAHAAALLLGVGAAYAVTQPASLLAGGVPRWDGWDAWHLPRDLVGAPFLLATAFVLCARVPYVLAARDVVGQDRLRRTLDAGGESRHGSLAMLGLAGCFVLLVAAFWMLFSATEYVFGWAQPNDAQMGAVCCLIALLRLLAAWNPRRLRLDPRPALAAGVLLNAGLAYGLGQSVLSLAVLGVGFAVYGRPDPSPPQRKASALAGRIRPSAWPWVR